MHLPRVSDKLHKLFGANGAGKTTTINILLGFLPPTSGTALIEGIDVFKEPLKSKDYLSFVSENVMLYGTFTAYLDRNPARSFSTSSSGCETKANPSSCPPTTSSGPS